MDIYLHWNPYLIDGYNFCSIQSLQLCLCRAWLCRIFIFTMKRSILKSLCCSQVWHTDFWGLCRVPQPRIFDIISISSIILKDKLLIYRRGRTDQVSQETGAFTELSKDKNITYVKLLLCVWKEDKYMKPLLHHYLLWLSGALPPAHGDPHVGACGATRDPAPLAAQQRLIPV